MQSSPLISIPQILLQVYLSLLFPQKRNFRTLFHCSLHQGASLRLSCSPNAEGEIALTLTLIGSVLTRGAGASKLKLGPGAAEWGCSMDVKRALPQTAAKELPQAAPS